MGEIGKLNHSDPSFAQLHPQVHQCRYQYLNAFRLLTRKVLRFIIHSTNIVVISLILTHLKQNVNYLLGFLFSRTFIDSHLHNSIQTRQRYILKRTLSLPNFSYLSHKYYSHFYKNKDNSYENLIKKSSKYLLYNPYFFISVY